MATLYLIATPIGNLEDITIRALRILKEVPCIAAEDTRRTRQLLTHYEIHPTLISFHEHNKTEKIPVLLAKLTAGDLALVSDAGTPVINDPGYELVLAAINAGHRIVPIPGASAPISALITSGLPPDSFLYLGYIPRKAAARKRKLEEISPYPFTMIFLETPQRLLTTLKSMLAILGDRRIAVARELTKLHEEIYRGTINQAMAHFSSQTVRGEITLVVSGASAHLTRQKWEQPALLHALSEALAAGSKPADIARQLARKSGWERREIYDLLTEIQNHSITEKSE